MKKKNTGSTIASLIRIGTFAGSIIYFTRPHETRVLDIALLSVLCLVWYVSGYWEGLSDQDET